LLNTFLAPKGRTPTSSQGRRTGGGGQERDPGRRPGAAGNVAAESVLAIESSKIPDLLAELTKSKRLSLVVGNLNRLMQQHSTDQELGRRALRHLGFLDD
jgi:hypothetical protein